MGLGHEGPVDRVVILFDLLGQIGQHGTDVLVVILSGDIHCGEKAVVQVWFIKEVH